MHTIIAAVLALSILGLISGMLLAFAYQKFEVKTDPKVEEVLKLLPGINCGACGYAGCRAFAEALVAGKAKASQCRPGQKAADTIAKALAKPL